MRPALQYRPDIDGLRAVAVLSVLGFHASADLVPGGYVGVDIFFVISGYLITSIIFRNLQQEKFSFIDFYARRAKRIFPALIVVLLASSLLGWLFLLRDEYQQLGKHIAAGAGFISNFALWQESGYFDKTAEYKPLLHLWSLGIEEQFYLLWPPLLLWAWKRKLRLLDVCLTIVAVSFVINIVLVSLWQARETYFLPPTRFWELLIGGALAYQQVFKADEFHAWLMRTEALLRLRRIRLADIVALIGALLIVIALWILNAESLFPGWWALLPTCGAALLIASGSNVWFNQRVLSSRPLVFIGIISYPLYLWHWPLLSFARIVESGAPPASTLAAALVLAFVLASLTYWIVEKPIRSKPNEMALLLFPALLVVAVLGLATFAHAVAPRSDQFGVEKIFAATTERSFPGPHLKSIRTPLGYHWEQGTGFHKVLFVGDSNMEQYYPRVDNVLTEQPQTTKGVIFVTQPGCLPIHYMKNFAEPPCAHGVIDRALSLAQRPDVDTVVIAAAWNGYAVFTDPAGKEPAFRDLEQTMRQYRSMGRRVYLILPIPRNSAFDPFHAVKRGFFDLGFTVDQAPLRLEAVIANVQPISAQLIQIAESTGATTIDPVQYLCQSNCPTFTHDGMPLYRDSAHLQPSYVRQHMTFLDGIVRSDQLKDIGSSY